MASGTTIARHLRVWFTLRSARRGLTAAELHERMPDISLPTLYRYLDLLTREGPGVEKEGDRWRVVPGAVAPLWLQDGEIIALKLAIEVLPARFRADLSELGLKLEAMLAPSKRDYLRALQRRQHVSTPGLAARSAHESVTGAVRFGFIHEQVVRIRYAMPDGAESTREIEPLGFLVNQGAEYVVAWCRMRRAVRQFSMLRVLHAELLDESFDPDPTFDLDAYARRAFAARAEEPLAVVVDLAPEVAYLARERVWHASQRAEPLAEGWTRLSFEASGLYEIAAWIAGLGGKGIVRGPPELVDRVRQVHREGLQALEPRVLMD